MDTSKQNMLHAHAMQLTLFPFAVFLMLTISAFAQNGIFIDSNVTCINTITRYKYNGTNAVHYVKTSDSTGHFLYNFSGGKAPIGNFYKIPITGYNITDFTVIRDTIYMCGVKVNGRGFCGWMKLGPSPVSVTLHLYHLWNDTSFVTDPRRIQVFNSMGGTQMVLVGNYFNPSDPNGNPAIVHIKKNVTSQFYVAYLPGEHFDDVTVLDDYVVTVARKGYNDPVNASQIMRVLPKMVFNLNSNIFKKCYTMKAHSADSRVLLQHLDNNNLVAVYQDDEGYYINSHWVDNSGYLHINQYLNVNTALKSIYDVSYNSTDTSLMVLHGKDFFNIASRFGCSLYPSISWIESYYPNEFGYCSGCPILLKSLSRMGTSKFMVSGIIGNDFMIWNTNGNCNISQYLSTTTTSSNTGYYEKRVVVDTIGMNTPQTTRPIQSTTVIAICQ